ncbi:phosphatase PAP2 family protein [Cellulomonas sp. 179-A 4D5 NHS]|uniref:phosphatase PAP2 family protein n=1 Tax=Cellulomonas sp. 179-A 4D5 NHS TaxID=3142378 RepID=UPI0039A22224
MPSASPPRERPVGRVPSDVPGGGRRASSLPGVLVAVVAVLGIVATWRVFVETWAGQWTEEAVLRGAEYGQGALWTVAEPVLDVVSVSYIALVLVAAMLIALVRRRWALAIQVVVLVAGSNVTTQLIKRIVTDRPDLGVPGPEMNALPSGHTTAAASVSAVLVLVVPPRVRPWAAALGAGYTAATGVSTLVGQWHRPSDVIAAVLVVLFWTCVTCVLVARHPGVPGDAPRTATGEIALARSSRSSVAGSRTGALLLGLVGVAAAVPSAVSLRRTWDRAGELEARADLLTAYAGAVLGVVAVSALAFAVILLVRHAATARVEAP